jgi:hypothetical protein
VKILSLFITSNRIIVLLNNEGVIKNETFIFYPFFQTSKDIEFLINSYFKSLSLELKDFLIIPITTIFGFEIFGVKPKFLSIELEKKNDFLYVYLDNLNFYSSKNISISSLGLSNRSDNFISNRSIYSANKFTGDIEEIIYLSKSINDFYKSNSRIVVFGGDYFTNDEIPNEFKLNLISEVLNNGFYEIYIDKRNEYPNFLNLRNNSSISLKNVEFEKFCYLVTSDKLVELLLESNKTQKYLNVKLNETFFLHFKNEIDLKIKYKGRDLKNGELLLDTDFSGFFIDLRSILEKKRNLGLESLRKVLASIEKENDYSSL